jgi:hypothetical protein
MARSGDAGHGRRVLGLRHVVSNENISVRNTKKVPRERLAEWLHFEERRQVARVGVARGARASAANDRVRLCSGKVRLLCGGRCSPRSRAVGGKNVRPSGTPQEAGRGDWRPPLRRQRTRGVTTATVVAKS